jgi:hypothetical protein
MNTKDAVVTRKSYTVSVEVARSPVEVFDHIINDIPKYWPEEFDGACAKLGDEFVFRSGDMHYSKNEVIEFVAGKKVVWLVTDSIRKTDNFKWTGTKMIFELTTKGGDTLVKFTYDGFIPANEYDRLVGLCDMIIKEKLYNIIIRGAVV